MPKYEATQKISGAENAFKASLNSRATKPPKSPSQALAILRSIKPPHASTYILLGLTALLLDILDIFETPADATIILFVVFTILEICFFLLIRALINRGLITSWALIGCLVAGIFISIIPIVGLFGIFLFIPIIIMGVFNKNAQVVTASQDDLLEHITDLRRRIKVGQQYVQKISYLSKSSPRLAQATQKLGQSRIGQTIIKKMGTNNRNLLFMLAEDTPFIEWVPFHLIGVYMTWRDQKHIYAQARELLVEYEAILSQLGEIDDIYVQEQLNQFTARTSNLHTTRSAPKNQTANKQAAPSIVGDIKSPSTEPPRIRTPQEPLRQPIPDILPAAPIAQAL